MKQREGEEVQNCWYQTSNQGLLRIGVEEKELAH
jgi:hypothetical protein